MKVFCNKNISSLRYSTLQHTTNTNLFNCCWPRLSFNNKTKNKTAATTGQDFPSTTKQKTKWQNYWSSLSLDKKRTKRQNYWSSLSLDIKRTKRQQLLVKSFIRHKKNKTAATTGQVFH